MKAKPQILIYGSGYADCSVEKSTHIKLNIPGPQSILYLPIITKGSKKDSSSWTWNADIDKPTLKPSILTKGGSYDEFNNYIPYVCHSWINDGQVVFLDDCSHSLKGKTVDLLEIE